MATGWAELVHRVEAPQQNGWFRRIILRPIWLGVTRVLPVRVMRYFFTRSCRHTHDIHHYARTHRALELMYGFTPKRATRTSLREWLLSCFWESVVENARAVRNRLHVATGLLVRLGIGAARRYGYVSILSLAAGSARTVIEALALLREQGIMAEAVLIDRSQGALKFAKSLAEERGVLEAIRFERGDVSQFEDYLVGRAPDIVEVIGLFEYLSDEQAVDLLARSWKCLLEGGTLIASNARREPETRFVERVVEWPRALRTAEELLHLAQIAGIPTHVCRVLVEPLGIQQVLLIEKCQ